MNFNLIPKRGKIVEYIGIRSFVTRAVLESARCLVVSLADMKSALQVSILLNR